MQHLITIETNSKNSWYVKDFKKSIALAIDELGMSQSKEVCELLHYDTMGKTLNGKPLCRFIGTKKMVGFISERSSGQQDIALMSQFVIHAASKHFGNTPIGLKMWTREKGITFSEFAQQYVMPGMVRKVRNSRRNLSAQAREAMADKTVKQEVMKMLECAYQQGFIDDLPEEKQLGLVVHEVGQVGLDFKEKLENADLIKAKFSMNYKLNGFWQAGQLTARGYGLLHYMEC